jgi:hypothetical protein
MAVLNVRLEIDDLEDLLANIVRRVLLESHAETAPSRDSSKPKPETKTRTQTAAAPDRDSLVLICKDALTGGRLERSQLAELLGEYDAKSISGIADEQLADFYEKVLALVSE